MRVHPPSKHHNIVTRSHVCVSVSVDVDELIKVQFTGVSIATNHATTWLNKITGSPVKFKLLYKNDHSAIECIVHSWRTRWLQHVCSKIIIYIHCMAARIIFGQKMINVWN